MLDKKHRLPGGVDFKNVGAVSSQAFLIKIKDNNLGLIRAAVIVSKKIDKRAVVRNKIKRKFRNCIDKIIQKKDLGKDILIIAKKESEGKSNQEILSILEKSLVKNKL